MVSIGLTRVAERNASHGTSPKRQHLDDLPVSESETPTVLNPPATPDPYSSPFDYNSSPVAPSPEPISPVLKKRQYGSTTYRSDSHYTRLHE